MASLSQLAKELLLSLAGGDPIIQKEYIDGMQGGEGSVQADGSVPFTAPEAGVDPVASNDLTTKNYVDNTISSHVVDVAHGGTGRTSVLLGTNIHVDPSGSDSTGDGSPTNPYKTIAHAQASFSDESISTGLGPEKNPAKQYNIILSAGTFIEANSWGPKQYVNYFGAGIDLSFVQHATLGTAITFAYGDNYGFTQNFQGITFNSELDVVRTAGFTDPTNLPTTTALVFNECSFALMQTVGSGFDNNYPNVVIDNLYMNRCTLLTNLAVSAMEINAQDCVISGLLQLQSTGVDGSIPLSGGLPSTAYGCQIVRIDIYDYVNIALGNSEVSGVHLKGATNNPSWTAQYGPAPAVLMDADSTAFVRLDSGAQQDQVTRRTGNQVLLGAYRNISVTDSPYTSFEDQLIFSDLDTPGPVAITLAGGSNNQVQKIIDYKGDASTNNITITAGRFDRIKGGGSGGTTWVIDTDGGSVEFLYSFQGSDPGLPQNSDISTVADVSGSLNNTFFNLPVMTGQFEELLYVPWFNVDGGGTAPVVADSILVEVDIASDASADDVAAALLSALQNSSIANYVDAEPGASNEVTISDFNSGPVTAISDGSAPTGFTLSVTQAGVDQINGTFVPVISQQNNFIQKSASIDMSTDGPLIVIPDSSIPSGKSFHMLGMSMFIDLNGNILSDWTSAYGSSGFQIQDTSGNVLINVSGGDAGLGTKLLQSLCGTNDSGMLPSAQLYQDQGNAPGVGVQLTYPGSTYPNVIANVNIWGVIK